MKLSATFIASLLLFCASIPLRAQTFSESRSLEAYATADESAKTITLSWNATPNSISFEIYRRELNSNAWGTAIATLDATTNSYTDANVETNSIYEYSIVRVTNTNDRLRSGNILGYSYITASIEAPAIHSRGTLWLLSTKLLSDSLPNEINTLTADLVADGWNVYKEVINPSASVVDVKDFIVSKHNTVGCDAVYLLGNVPVPYSGLYCEDNTYPYPPDGHNETDPNSHCGAWPADAFYGDMTGTWTDEGSTTLATRDENNNAIGDGKYDQHRIPGVVSVAIGRVDLSRLPVFGMSEVALTKRYLTKVHQYKMGNTPLVNQGVVENNFSGFDEGFSSAALRDFYAICGTDAVVEEDLLAASREKDYMLSYVCGAGSYTNCSGFGTTDSFVSNNTAAFNHMFGSYFGDWDIANNLMRASLGSERLGFNVIWSGRPKWATHTLAIGESYADITKRSQNNWQDYDGNYYQNGTHLALLGDPSLRIHAMKPAKNISVQANEDRDAATVSWDGTDENNILGYFIYRSHRETGKYLPINDVPITETTYTDATPYDGTNHYMVRVAKKQQTGSGNYINLSLGISVEINAMRGEIASYKEEELSKLKVYPTVATTVITLERELPSVEQYIILNPMGQQVAAGELTSRISQVDISNLSSGAYFIKIAGATHRFIKR